MEVTPSVVAFVMGPMGSVTLRLLLTSLNAPPLPAQETLCIVKTLSAILDPFAPLYLLQGIALGSLGMFQGASPYLILPLLLPQLQLLLLPLPRPLLLPLLVVLLHLLLLYRLLLLGLLNGLIQLKLHFLRL